MPRLEKPYVATLDEVTITRSGDTAFIEYSDPDVSTVHLRLGIPTAGMTDEEILQVHNDVLRAQAEIAAEYDHVAVEVPPGSAQLRYFPAADQWSPRGDVLRCIIDDGGPDCETTVWVDDQELSLREFGRLLSTYNGWGMRICFVPDDETEVEPTIEVREPSEGHR